MIDLSFPENKSFRHESACVGIILAIRLRKQKIIRQFFAAHSDFVISSEFNTWQDLISRSCRDKAKVIIIDMLLPGLGGSGCIRQFGRHRPDMTIMVFDLYSENRPILRILNKGVCHYYLKANSIQDLFRSVHTFLSAKLSYKTITLYAKSIV